MKYAFIDYNSVRLHSSISFLPPDEFGERWNENEDLRTEFMEERKRRDERRLNNRINIKMRLMENVSLEDGISVQN